MARLYIISPPRIEDDLFIDQLQHAFDGGDVACFQLRLKDGRSDKDIIKLCEKIYPICQERKIAFLLNDFHHLIGKAPMHGIHIGEEDGEVKNLRKRYGSEIIIGASCYDVKERALEAAEGGADYVSFGAFYPTKTKKKTGKPTLELLKWWHDNTITPVSAIGGMRPDNCMALVENGADFICVVSYIWEHENGAQTAVKEFDLTLRNT